MKYKVKTYGRITEQGIKECECCSNTEDVNNLYCMTEAEFDNFKIIIFNISDDLAEYCGDVEFVKSIVLSKIDRDEISKDIICLEWAVETSKKLNKDEKLELIDYIEGQCSDGWGEDIELDMKNKDRHDICFEAWYNGNKKSEIEKGE